MLLFVYIMSIVFQATAIPSSFLGLARADPKSFVNLFDQADPNTINKIINILVQIMNENVGKINKLDTQLSAAILAVNDAKLDKDNQEVMCDGLHDKLKEALKDKNHADGLYNKAKSTFDTRDPQLVKELNTLKQVIKKLKSMQNSNSSTKSRRLLALSEMSVITSLKYDPQAFLESLVDADPKKLKTVIDLVQTLIDDAQKEKDSITKSFNDAKEVKKNAEVAWANATSAVGTCKSNLSGKDKTLSELQGSLETIRKTHQHRIPILKYENNKLQEVIDDLKPLAASPKKE